MSAVALLRFVDPIKGPIVALTSAPFPGFFRRRVWYSSTQLLPGLTPASRQYDSLGFGGGGWDQDKETSQCKAVGEAIERWAFTYYLSLSQKQAGLDLDPTTNGFAAYPVSLGLSGAFIHGYNEAIERWILDRFWEGDKIFFVRQKPDPDMLPVLAQGPVPAKVSCFGTKVSSIYLPDKELYFTLCLLETKVGGVIPGSCCGTIETHVICHAMLEAYNNSIAAKNMLDLGCHSQASITDHRLNAFAWEPGGVSRVLSRMRLTDIASSVIAPEICFSVNLPGPWNPEVMVHRVLVSGARPITEGGSDRFII